MFRTCASPKFSTPVYASDDASTLIAHNKLHLPCINGEIIAGVLITEFGLYNDTADLLVINNTTYRSDGMSEPGIGSFVLLAECFEKDIHFALTDNDFEKKRHIKP